MQRTVLHPARGVRATAAEDQDKYGDKLVKYVPAEVIAFFVPTYAIANEQEEWARWLVLILGVIGTLGYLFVRSDASNPSRSYFYTLAAVAFLAWAIGTSSVGSDLWGIEDWLSKITVTAAVFLVPMFDEVLTRIWPKSWP